MTINLLPPKLKQEKEFKKISKTVVLFLSFLFLILIGFTASIYFADQQVKGKSRNDNDKISEEEASLLKLKPIETKVNIINSKLDKISQIDSKRAYWSVLIKDLAGDTPQKVQIKTLSADKNTNRIDITGSAQTRRDIAAFKEKLEASNYFKNVTFYTSSLETQSNEYTFTMSCELENLK